MGNRIIVEGSNAYVTNWDPNGNYKLFIFDISDYLNPIQTGELDLQYYPYGIDYKDNIVYAACSEGGLFVIDVSDKYNPFIKKVIYYGNHSMSYACVSDDYLYVTDGINGLLVFDITNSDYINLVGQFLFGNYAYYVKEYRGKIYVSSFEAGLYIFQNDLIASVLNQQPAVPADYLLQNFPNPFNPTTTISFGLSKNEFVSLKVYNMLGEEIATLINEEMSSGIYKVEFNGTNLASGIYIYTIKTPSHSITKKMILTK
ncbi:MAG TPA: T9SS type A sorting domain-containing protein [Ignavibacteriaceae bacterium]|nr:T9SS type A sorting domain-containing protein [Ignavibacteriaceae bacterium]